MNTLPTFRRPQLSAGLMLLAVGLLGLVLALQNLERLSSHPLPAAVDVASALDQLPLAFVPNRGQSDPAVRFELRSLDSSVAFAPQEVVLQLPQETTRLRFLGANPAPDVAAGQPLPGTINDFRGSDPAGWYSNIPTYAGIGYQNLYPGISLRYEGTDGHLKSTFAVAPGADPSLIRWQYSDATAVAVDETSGDLQVTLAAQTGLVEQAPRAWQQIDGRRVDVPVTYALAVDGSVGFQLGAFDPAFALVIDPTIVYETVANLAAFDSGQDIAVDDAGNVYVTGRAYDSNNDVFVAKLSATGELLYTTYLRGSAGDFVGGLALDGAGDVYLTGSTDSGDFPVLNARQPFKNGTPRDAFITKLSGQDGTIQFSTYFGGSRSDEGRDIVLNNTGDIYLVGDTGSTDFPTLNPLQSGLNLRQCFCEDLFVTRLSPDARTLLFSTYLGGSFQDYGRSIGLDGNDNIYLAGEVESNDFPTVAPFQAAYGGGQRDGVVARIAADGSRLDYSTYLGGEDWDFVGRIAVDAAGYAFVVGSTRSADFPTTGGAYREQFIGGILACGSGAYDPLRNCEDIYVTKLAPDGSALTYSTFLGGGLEDVGRSIALDSADQAVVAGYSHSADFPGGGGSGMASDIVLVKLDGNGSDVLYTVRVNSASYNQGHGVAIDGADNAYLTAAQNAPSDLYVAKISDGSTAPAPTPTSTPQEPTPTPTPTSTPEEPAPTATASASTMHVGDLDGASATAGRNRWQATVTVLVEDAGHNPLSGAIVGGAWSDGYSGSAQCTTGTDGRCSISSGNIYRKNNSTTFTVAGVQQASFTYDPTANHDPDGDSNGTSITVLKP